ncbi:hypothetical protein D9M68_932330 [compost metagenome]
MHTVRPALSRLVTPAGWTFVLWTTRQLHAGSVRPACGPQAVVLKQIQRLGASLPTALQVLVRILWLSGSSSNAVELR